MLTREHVTIPQGVCQYSVNEAYLNTFPESYQQYLAWVKNQTTDGGCSSRYIGSLVADFHRILLRGGVYLYPPTDDKPDGKLRLMYEASPLAFIVEQAGGAATDGRDAIMNKQPTSLHERTPLIIGSSDNVENVMGFVRQSAAA